MIYGIEKTKAILRTQSEILQSVREFLRREGFIEVLPPMLDSITDPGIRGAEFFEVDYYGKKYKLMSAMTVHKPIIAKDLGKIFAFCPCWRKESEESKFSKRHLAQFWQIEVEIPEASYEDAMGVVERLVQYVCSEIIKKCPEELKFLGRELKTPSVPFKRIKHEEAVDIAKRLGMEAFYDKELSWEIEKTISMKFTEPFFITEYPIGSRGFYDKTDGSKLLDFDLMFDSGFGEGCSGSEREYEYEKVLKKVEGTEIAKCEWYLEILKKGIKPTAGFGIGLERLTRYICGLQAVREATPFPILPGVIEK